MIEHEGRGELTADNTHRITYDDARLAIYFYDLVHGRNVYTTTEDLLVSGSSAVCTVTSGTDTQGSSSCRVRGAMRISIWDQQYGTEMGSCKRWALCTVD
jgi:hypothetical protein